MEGGRSQSTVCGEGLTCWFSVRANGENKESLLVDFPHFLLFGKKRSQKSEQGVSPLDPAALPTVFYDRRGSFVFTKETPMEHGFHRLVGYFITRSFSPTSWVRCGRLVYKQLPHDVATKCFVQRLAKDGWGRSRRGKGVQNLCASVDSSPSTALWRSLVTKKRKTHRIVSRSGANKTIFRN